MPLIQPNRQFQIDPKQALLYGLNTPNTGAPTTGQQPSAPPVTAPQPDSMAAAAADQPAFKMTMPTPPAPMQTVPPPTPMDDWAKEQQGKGNYVPYKIPGFWRQLASALAYGAAETAGEMNRNPGLGVRGMEATQNRQWEAQRYNNELPGRIAAAYNESQMQPYLQRQEGAVRQYGADVNRFGTEMQAFNAQREMQAKAQEVLSSYLSQKGKMDDEAVVQGALRDSVPYGGLNEAYVRRVVGAAPTVNLPSVERGEGGAPNDVVFKGQRYVPELDANKKPTGRLLDATGKPVSDPAVMSAWTAAAQGHSRERSEKLQDQQNMLNREIELWKTRMGPLGGNINVPAGVSGPQVLSAIPQELQPVVQMIGDGKMDFQTFTARFDPTARTNLANLVHAYNPNFDQATFSVRKGMQESATSGKIGDTLTAFDTATQHLDTLERAAQALNNGDVPALNKAANALGVQAGKDQATTFRAIQNVIAGEVNKAISGAGNVTEGEMQQARGLFNEGMSPAQLAGAIKATRELMQSKRNVLQQRINNGMQGRPLGALPAISSAGDQQAHVIQIGNKRYQYKGAGDTADLSNYTEIR